MEEKKFESKKVEMTFHLAMAELAIVSSMKLTCLENILKDENRVLFEKYETDFNDLKKTFAPYLEIHGLKEKRTKSKNPEELVQLLSIKPD